jgi:acetyl-CoA carboxylase biotin carboxyl carrier protein
MTGHPEDGLERKLDAARVATPENAVPDTEAEELSDLLEQTREATVQLLSDFETAPQSLQVRAGAVSVDVTWEDKPTLVTTIAAVAAEPEADVDPDIRYLTAPAVGVFYPAPKPGASPFVGVGDSVTVGQQVAIIEAMKLMIPLEADKDGRVVEVLKENGEPVEYGERVFTLAGAEDE